VSEALVDPTLDDPFLMGDNEGLGGRLGDHVRQQGSWWTPLRVTLVLLGGSLLIGYFQKLPCRDTSTWKDQFQFTHVCYTDVLASWTSYGLNNGAVPYFGFNTPYPPLTGWLMGLAAFIAGRFPQEVRSGVYFDVTVVLLTICAVVVVITTALLASKKRPWDALMVAVAPVMIMQAFTNWDMLSLAFMGVAMVMWSRRLPLWTGVWLGLAVGAKFWPLLLLLGLLMLCVRAGQMRAWTTTAVTTLATWAAISVPLLILAPDGAKEFWRTNIARGPDWDSLWLPIDTALGWGADTINWRVIVVLVVVTAGVVFIVFRAPRRPRVAQVMFVLLALFMVFGKVFSPQDALWLTPLAVLARPRWRAFLTWQISEVALTVLRMLMLVGLDKADKGLPRGWWYVTVGVRDLTLLILVAFVIREMWNPARDVVRADGEDDPAGGVLNDSVDHVLVLEPVAVGVGQEVPERLDD
jgi:hypothetical protein